jgi:hypothetical protein
MVSGDNLRDHPAHRRADDVGAVDVERIRQPDDIARHVGEAIGRPHRHPQSGACHERGRGEPSDRGHFRRQGGVAVVETNDTEASAHQPVAEFVGPCGELHAEAHDQHHRRAVARPDRLVFDLNGVRRNGCHLALVLGSPSRRHTRDFRRRACSRRSQLFCLDNVAPGAAHRRGLDASLNAARDAIGARRSYPSNQTRHRS